MKYLLTLLALISINSFAASPLSAGTPTGIDLIKNQGFMVYGAFGKNTQNADCTESNKFFVKMSHPQYQEIYSMVLTAFSSGAKITPYARGCEANGWYTVPTVLYSTLRDGDSVYLRN